MTTLVAECLLLGWGVCSEVRWGLLGLPLLAWNRYFKSQGKEDQGLSILSLSDPRQSPHSMSGSWAEEGSPPLSTILTQDLASNKWMGEG